MISTITLNPALDKTVYVSQLAPNETNRVSKVEVDAGGKGINCARMLSELGTQTRAVALLGGGTGAFVRMVLESEGIPLTSIPTAKPTRTCIAIQESDDLPPTSLNEPGGPVEHQELVKLLEETKDIARESSYLVFGGSVPVGINDDVYNVLIQIAKSGSAKAVLDADGEALIEGIKAKPFMIKPNRCEAERALDKEFESKSDVARAALQFAEMGIELVVITLGSQGAIAAYEGMVYEAVPPEVDAISTIGSGDSLIAGMLHSLEADASIEDALRLGCAAGAATAMSSGVEIGKKSDVDELVSKVKVSKVQPAAK